MRQLYLVENYTPSLQIKLQKGEKGTKAEVICKIIKQLPRSVRHKCKEITLDFANNMSLIAKECFPQAVQVSDRFHLHKLVHEALQDVRVKY